MKAVAVHSIFIIITTIVFFFFAIVIIFGFINIVGLEANQATCTVKILNYCSSWVVNDFSDDRKPYTWNKKDPISCSSFLKIKSDAEGPSKGECIPIVK